jgi:hypothetical protein
MSTSDRPLDVLPSNFRQAFGRPTLRVVCSLWRMIPLDVRASDDETNELYRAQQHPLKQDGEPNPYDSRRRSGFANTEPAVNIQRKEGEYERENSGGAQDLPKLEQIQVGQESKDDQQGAVREQQPRVPSQSQAGNE